MKGTKLWLITQAYRPYPMYGSIDSFAGGGGRLGHTTYHAMILKYNGQDWLDAVGRPWNDKVRLSLPDKDVFVIDANANRSADPGEQVLSRHKAPPGRLVIRTSFTDATAPFYVAYNAAGRSCRAAHPNAANFGTITLELAGVQRNIKINMQGRARVCDPALEPTTCASI